MTIAEHDDIIRKLIARAQAAKDDQWRTYLLDLARHYEHERARTMRDEPSQSPPGIERVFAEQLEKNKNRPPARERDITPMTYHRRGKHGAKP